jgi:CRISPR/Cas system-associated exonuclease Cas4 (RecB family)
MLVNISDLQTTPQPVQDQCVKAAMSLSTLWDVYKAQQSGERRLEIVFRGERDRAPGIHASELSGCPRKLTYGAMGVPRELKAEDKNVWMQRVFDMGNIVHAYIQQEFHDMCGWLNQNGKQLTFQDEASIHPRLGGVAQGYNLHSSADGIFTFWRPVGPEVYEPWMRVVLEIKTASDKQYTDLKQPKEDHAEQTCLYMRALDVPLTWVVYMNKSNQRVTQSEPPFLFKFNSALWEQLERRITTVYGYTSNGQLPARQEGHHCGWCPFAHTCQPAYLKGGKSYSPPPDREF